MRLTLNRLPSVIALLTLALSSACVPPHPSSLLQSAAQRSWDATLSTARALADSGKTSTADSVLAQYAASYPNAPQAIEAQYWRAFVNLEGPLDAQHASFVVPLLQSYVAAGRSTEHWMDANVLLRLAARVDTLSHVTMTYVTHGDVVSDPTKPDAKPPIPDARDDEIKRLKDELAKSKDELDRIKKRLAEPPKKPPTSE